MIYAEIVFETGNKSVACYENEAEMEYALAEHHRRAINGEPGSPSMNLRSDIEPGEARIGTWVAERVKKVFLYDEHPADFGQDQLVDAEELKTTVEEAIAESEMNGVVHVHTVAAKVRDMSSPLVTEPPIHGSQYKAPETKMANLSFLKKVEADNDE